LVVTLQDKSTQRSAVQAVIVVPTRELGMQVRNVVDEFSDFKSFLVCYYFFFR